MIFFFLFVYSLFGWSDFQTIVKLTSKQQMSLTVFNFRFHCIVCVCVLRVRENKWFTMVNFKDFRHCELTRTNLWRHTFICKVKSTLHLLQSNSKPANIIIVCNEYFGDAISLITDDSVILNFTHRFFLIFFFFAHYCFSWFLFVDSFEQRLMIDRCQTFENKKPVNIKKTQQYAMLLDYGHNKVVEEIAYFKLIKREIYV